MWFTTTHDGDNTTAWAGVHPREAAGVVAVGYRRILFDSLSQGLSICWGWQVPPRLAQLVRDRAALMHNSGLVAARDIAFDAARSVAKPLRLVSRRRDDGWRPLRT